MTTTFASTPVHKASRRRLDYSARLGLILGLWLACVLGYWLAFTLGAPAWVMGLLRYLAGSILIGLLVFVFNTSGYRRGVKEADDWYEPRVHFVREQVHMLMLDEISRYRCDDPLCGNDAAHRCEEVRELNDWIQSAGFWGRRWSQ